MNQLEELLKECTVQVRLSGHSGGWGTGFFVASSLLLTCDHVVKGAKNGAVEVRCKGQDQWIKARVEKTLSKPYDLALVQVALPEEVNHPPCVYLGEGLQPRDPLYLFGFPDIGKGVGEPRTFKVEGTTGSDIGSILLKQGQVRPGMSGSALLNQRTGKVCGMVQFTREKSIDLGGGALPTWVILEQFPELMNLQKAFHQQDHRWREHLKWDGAPYPGLTAFEKADAPIFFGRDDDIQEGIKELRNLRDREERLFIYLGASGSGKSSLVRAGMLPELEKPIHADDWIVVPPFRPINEGWGDPFENLAFVLSEAFEAHGTPRDSDSIQQQLMTPQQRHGLLKVVRGLAKATKRRQTTVLIIIDQFEELLGQTASGQAQQFLAWFGEGMVAAQQLKLSVPPLIVLATMRSDFLPAFQQCRALQPSVKIFPKLVNPIPMDRFGELIEGPADLVGLKLGTGLVQQIVSDANTENSLPLLAFTLAKLYEQYGRDGLLETEEYKQLGRLTGAVSQEAQRIFDNYLAAANLEKEAGDQLLRQAFLKLVRLDADGKTARRLASWQELPVAAQPLMEKFVAGRLLTKSVKEEKLNSHDIQIQHDETLVEVSHEALFTEWGLLRECIDESREHLLDKQRIEATAKEWQDTKQPKALLLTGERLKKATAFGAVCGQDFPPLNEAGKEFVAASQRANAVKVFFQRTLSTARDITTSLKLVVSLVAIARAEAAANELEDAQHTLYEALSRARGEEESAEQGQMLVEIALATRQLSDADHRLERIISCANGSSASITAIAQAAGQLSDPQLARAILEKATTAAETITDAFFRSDTLISIAQAYDQLSDPQLAQAFLEKAVAAAETIDGCYTSFRSFTRCSLSDALCDITQAAGQLSDPQLARAILEKATTVAETRDRGFFKNNALISIAQAYSQLPDPWSAQAVLEKATTAMETLTGRDKYGHVLIKVVKVAGQISDPQFVQALLEKAITAAKALRSSEANKVQSYVLRRTAKFAGQISDPQSSQALLEKVITDAKAITDAKYRSGTLISIAQIYGQLSDLQSAQALLEKAITAAETITNASERSGVLLSNAQAYCQISDLQSAQALLEKAITAAETITNASERSDVLISIAQAYCQISDLQSAQALLEKATTAAETITNASKRSDVLSRLLKVQESLETSEMSLDGLPNVPDELQNFLDSALTDIKNNPQRSNYSRYQALLKITQALQQCPETANAKALLDRTLPLAQALTLIQYRDKVLGALAVAYGRIASWGDAIQTLEACADGEKTEALTQILDLWVKHYNFAPIKHDL